MTTIELTMDQLEEILIAQKRVTAEYITRNLTVYKWFMKNNPVDITEAKVQLFEQCLKSDFPEDFNILKKYIK